MAQGSYGMRYFTKLYQFHLSLTGNLERMIIWCKEKTTIRTIAAVLATTIAVALNVASDKASAQDIRYFYCFASSQESGKTYASDTLPVGPVGERSRYGEEFVTFLRAKGLVPPATSGYCVMRSTKAETDTSRSDLSKDCRNCGTATTLEEVAWARQAEKSKMAGRVTASSSGSNSLGRDCVPEVLGVAVRPGTYRPRVIDARCGSPAMRSSNSDDMKVSAIAKATSRVATIPSARGTFQPKIIDAIPSASVKYIPKKASTIVPPEVGAPLPSNAYVQLYPSVENAYIQVHTRFFLCGDNIYLSYSMRPVVSRNISEVRFWGTITGNFGPTLTFTAKAHMEPGHALGCQHQKVIVKPLSDYEHRLLQTHFINGDEVWSREDMIRHLLGGFHVNALPSPWPAGAIGAPPSANSPSF